MPDANKHLTKAVVNGREGYVNSNKLIFSIPLSAKKVDFWINKMKEAGYTFNS